MEARAKAKTVRVSASKAKLVADLIKFQKVSEAFATLENSPQKSARLFKKVLNSAVANATENHGMTVDELTIVRAIANEGPTMKRYKPRAKGRADHKYKRTANLEIVVSDEYKKGKK